MDNFQPLYLLTLFLWVCFGFWSVSSEDVFISRSDGIHRVEIQNNVVATTSRLLQSSDGEIIALAIDTHDQLLFWYDTSTGNSGIYKGSVASGAITGTTMIVNYPEMYVTGLAVDWIIKHMYWSDSTHSCVMVSDYSGNHRVVAVTSRLMLPRGISVDPINRSLYVGDQGSHLILKCNMDGLFSCTHTTEGVVWPNQLLASSRNVAWTDGWSNKVVSCSSELSDCRTTMVNTQNLINTNGTSLFGMVNTTSGTFVSTLSKFVLIALQDNSTSTSAIWRGNNYYIISASSATQQIVPSNPCQDNANGCSQLCFSSSTDQPRCSCSSLTTDVLSTNGISCRPATRFLLYAEEDRGQIGLFSTNLNGHTIIAWSPKPRALAYDPQTKTVYFSDAKYQTISKVGLNGSSLAVFLSQQDSIGIVEAMTLDLQQRRLYFINRFEWKVNNRTRSMARIEMAGLTTSERVVIRHTEDRITDIEIIQHQTASYLYYAVGTPSPAVYKMSLDGRKRVMLSLPSLVNPTRLSSTREMLYILNNQQLISWSNGSSSTHDLGSQAVSMTSDSRSVYLSAEGFSMFKFNRFSGIAGDPVSVDVDPIDMVYVDTRVSGSTSDAGLCDDNSSCKSSSVCIKTDNPAIVRCKCPANKFNTPTDGSRTCTEPTKYLLASDVDGIKMMSLDDVLKNVFTIVPNEENCRRYHGLTTDGKRIFFAGYDGKIIYTASTKGEEPAVLMVLRDMTVLNLAYHDNTLYWTGHYDCFMYNGSVGGTLQCETFQGKLGGVFSLDVTPGSSTEQQVTTLVADIDDPQGVIADFSFLYWSDKSAIRRLSLRHTSAAPAIVSSITNIFALQQNKQQTSLFLGGSDVIALRLFTSRNFDLKQISPDLDMFDIRGISVQGSLVFASDWNSSRVIQYDLRTYQTKIVARTLGQPGQILAFGLDTTIKNKPGKCPTASSCNTVANISCHHDTDCLDSFRSKCCLTRINNQCRRECISPVSETTCNVTFGGRSYFTWGYESVTNDNLCTTCSCTPNGQSQCTRVKCPSLDGCGFKIREPGTCCAVCRDITSCKGKPRIVGCPANTIVVRLSAALPDTNRDEPVQVSLQHNEVVKNITAFSCNHQEIPVNKKSLMPPSLTWQMGEQIVSLIANDDNGMANCDMRVRILDTTKPEFISSLNRTVITFISKDENGAQAQWTEPAVYDNSGFPPTIRTNYTNGQTFSNGFHEIKYLATDGAGNSQELVFYVNVSLITGFTCSKEPLFFHHGSMECITEPNDDISCTAKCQRGFIFKSEFSKEHTCFREVWQPPFPPSFSSACFKPEPSILEVATKFSASIECQGKLITRENIAECMRTRLPCKIENIVLCEKDAVSIKQVDSGTKVTIQISGKVLYTEDNFETAKIRMNQTLSTIASGVEQLFSTAELDEFCPFLECSAMRQKGRTFMDACEKGSVIHHVESGSICGKCPPGSRFLETNGQSKCEMCAANTYQNEPGQTECKMCPEDRPYSKDGSWLVQHCKEDKFPTDSESSSLVSIVIGVLVAFFVLVLVLIVILVVKKRNARGKTTLHSHTNPAFSETGDGYDSIPADQEKPGYTTLTAVRSDPQNQYACLGKSPAVTYTSGGAVSAASTDDPYCMIGEKNPYEDLKLRKSTVENPYEGATSK